MREIKFRAWHKEQKKMYSPEEMGQDQLTLMPDGRGFVNVHTISRLSVIDNGQKMIPLEFTGLHDKNGVEIFEGDILAVIDPNGEPMPNIKVEWDNYACTYPFEIAYHDFDVTSLGWAMQMEYTFEVIGNIYSNPELMEKG